jgi:hypothetical protein
MKPFAITALLALIFTLPIVYRCRTLAARPARVNPRSGRGERECLYDIDDLLS